MPRQGKKLYEPNSGRGLKSHRRILCCRKLSWLVSDPTERNKHYGFQHCSAQKCCRTESLHQLVSCLHSACSAAPPGIPLCYAGVQRTKKKVIQWDPVKWKQQIFSPHLSSRCTIAYKNKTQSQSWREALLLLAHPSARLQVVSCLQVPRTRSGSTASQGYDQARQFASLGLYTTAVGFSVNSPHPLLLKGKKH